jgi:hypothetical protein
VTVPTSAPERSATPGRRQASVGDHFNAVHEDEVHADGPGEQTRFSARQVLDSATDPSSNGAAFGSMLMNTQPSNASA